MHIFNLNIPLGLLIVMGIVLVIVVIVLAIKFVSAIRSAIKRKATIAAIEEEEERIANLPKLDTRYLIRIPSSVKPYAKGEPRTFSIRYNRLVIYDERGNGWVGLFMPETFRSLFRGEYVWKDHWVPFCGDGEACAGEPADVNGQKISIYPKWMDAEKTDTTDWTRWAELETVFKVVHRERIFSDDFHQNMPYQERMEIFAKRRRLTEMKESVALSN